jgi:acyl-CoA synthetase (AMP-forming)/AMP-acid ligase II
VCTVIRTELTRPVPELLAEHAAHRPEQIALFAEHRQISYRELAANTARLAAHLTDIGMIEIDEMPRTGSGEILRFRLRERLAE